MQNLAEVAKNGFGSYFFCAGMPSAASMRGFRSARFALAKASM
jgi:hypothetical protein